jgi:hypothetical protein
VSGRYKDGDGNDRFFELRREVAVRDGAGREFARVRGPVKLNRRAEKQLRVDGAHRPKTHVWGFSMRTVAGDLKRCSGWILREALADPPDIGFDPSVNPKPPGEGAPLVIDCDRATRKLSRLRFKDSKGKFPKRGNNGKDYGGRNPGSHNYINLLFNVPNVVGGGVAKDTIPNGGLFVPALDRHGKPIRERMNMYRGRHRSKKVRVYFVYGRAEDGESWGWIAQANVGRIS